MNAQNNNINEEEMLEMFSFGNFSPRHCAEKYVDYIKRINGEITFHHALDDMKKQGKDKEAFIFGIESDYISWNPSKFARKYQRKDDKTIKDKTYVVPTKLNEWETKFAWLMDYLIREYYLSCDDNGYCKLNSRLLISVIGEDYAKMLDMLCKERLIHIPVTKCTVTFANKNIWAKHKKPIIRREQRTYYLVCNTFEQYIMPKIRIQKYVDKKKLYFEKHANELSMFMTEYQQNLLLLKIDKEEELKTWMSNRQEVNGNKDYSCKIIYDAYKAFNKNRLKEDSNGRIHSILSRTPRRMKPFLNRKFEVDISNCHPLLLNIILDDLIESVDNNSCKLRQYIASGHEVSAHLPLPHINSIILSELVKDLNKDGMLKRELERYKTLTENGVFWDMLLQKYNNDDRTTMKKEYFGSVFYGKFLRIRNYKEIVVPEDLPQQNNETDGMYNARVAYRASILEEKNRYMYANDFRKMFPCLWKLLVSIRRNITYKDVEWQGMSNVSTSDKEKPKTWLSLALMRIESSIIRYTLQKLWDEGYKVLNIHDSIFVLDVPANQDLTAEHVKETLLNTLSIYGLKGEVKIEY